MYRTLSLSPTLAGVAREPQRARAFPAVRTCAAAASSTSDRCRTPHACPPIPELLCVREVDGIPFEYVRGHSTDPGTRLVEATSRPASERITPPVLAAVRGFTRNLTRFGIPVRAILTLGSYYCRCISNKDQLSNHSFGDALDVAGVRWATPRAVPSRTRETIVNNFRDREQRQALRRLNACLRLSFATVIDYHRSDHQDHFHCDMNQGRGRTLGSTTVVFVQEALTVLTGTRIPETGLRDAATNRALRQFLRLPANAPLPRALGPVYDAIFTRIASGREAVS
jgi:hypothetical protein